jgi:hypothetical protein
MSRMDSLSSRASLGLKGLSSSMPRILVAWRRVQDAIQEIYQDGTGYLSAEEVFEGVIELGIDVEDHGSFSAGSGWKRHAQTVAEKGRASKPRRSIGTAEGFVLGRSVRLPWKRSPAPPSIDVADTWIGVAAVTLGIPLATNKPSDYASVDGLTVLARTKPREARRVDRGTENEKRRELFERAPACD